MTAGLSSATIQISIDQLQQALDLLMGLKAEALARELYDLHIGTILIVTFSNDPISRRMRIEDFSLDENNIVNVNVRSVTSSGSGERVPSLAIFPLVSRFVTWVVAPDQDRGAL